MDDKVLIDGLLHKDKRSFYQFYRSYVPKLLVFVHQKIANDQDAEEVLQDALLGFFEALRDFQGKSSLSTFLWAITRRKIIDYYRKKKVYQSVFSQSQTLESLISPVFNPEETLDAAFLKERLRSAFSRILPHYALVLKLKYSEDRTVQDIARKYSWTVKKTECLLARARKAFVREF